MPQAGFGESNISYKGNIDYQTFAPRPLGLGITSVGRRDACSSDRIEHANVRNTASFEPNVHHQRGQL